MYEAVVKACRSQVLLGTSTRWRFSARLASGTEGTPHSLQEDYSLFHLDEFCSSEELRSAYDITIKRNSNNISQVKAINLAYHRIMVDRVSTAHLRAQQDQEGSQERMKYHVPKIKSGGSIDSMVNARVSQQMGKVDVSDLKGFGKPLPKKYDNPYIDNLEGKLNEIMRNTGVANDWIEMKKSIVADLRDAKYILADHYSRYLKQKTGAHKRAFERASEEFAGTVRKLNVKVMEYNMLVPGMLLHMVPFHPQREYQRVVAACQHSQGVDVGQTLQMPTARTSPPAIATATQAPPVGPQEEPSLLQQLTSYIRRLFQ